MTVFVHKRRVLINGLFLVPGKVGGAETYLVNILKGLVARGYTENVSLLLDKAFAAEFHPIISQFDIIFINIKLQRRLSDYLTYWLTERFQEFDVIFQPNYISPFFCWKGKKKVNYYTTIHDLQYLSYPALFSQQKRLWLYYSHLHTLQFADKVLCISEFVKQDIIKHFGKKYAPKLQVIYNSIDFDSLEEIKYKNVPDEPYLLSVSALWPHKNTLTLIKAFNSFKASTGNPIKLMLVGQSTNQLRSGNFAAYHKMIQNELSKSKDIQFTGYVSEEKLVALYNQCSLFIFPSLFEGFGMPAIEASGLGKPVITTKCGAIEEVTLGKGIYVNDPLNHEEWAEKIAYGLNNIEALRRACQENAFLFKEKYGVQKVAGEYIKLFYS